jgi:hypothetical protein
MVSEHILLVDELKFPGSEQGNVCIKMRIHFRSAVFFDEYTVMRYLDESAKRIVWIVYWYSSSPPPGASSFTLCV